MKKPNPKDYLNNKDFENDYSKYIDYVDYFYQMSKENGIR